MFEPDEVSNIKDTIQEVLDSEDSLNHEYVSIFEIISIYQEIKADRERLKKKIETRISAKIRTVNANCFVLLHDFDYEEDQVCLSVYQSSISEATKFYFRKINDIIIELCNTIGEKIQGLDDVLSLIGVEIEDWYDYCYALKEVNEQHSYEVKSVNSVFFVNISDICVVAYYNKNAIISDFRILSFCDGKNPFYCKCKIDNVIESVKGREIEFVEKLFVRIVECPKWMQKDLSMLRQEQITELEKEKQAEKERKEKLIKKQKKHEFWKKIFPFIK